ncbi:hypothetical protein BpHYR1_048457 [Brachionus plicatilis]|uniref:Uncharacterized protein n=1 Tax=Brachionus plicatilis TaxID=10195 RepID=A0A3M7PKW1_BRAPC|nr:hypothetical protein BpHYR1_048457 [Brachionus plicatilis]
MHKYIMALVTVVKDHSKTIEVMKAELAEAKNPTGGMEELELEMRKEDEEKVEMVLKALKLDRSKTVKRFRRIRNNKSNKNRCKKELDMIVAEFNEESRKHMALGNAKNLRGTEDLKNVYINPDKVPSERALERELRTERNKRNDLLSESKSDSEY